MPCVKIWLILVAALAVGTNCCHHPSTLEAEARESQAFASWGYVESYGPAGLLQDAIIFGKNICKKQVRDESPVIYDLVNLSYFKMARKQSNTSCMIMGSFWRVT